MLRVQFPFFGDGVAHGDSTVSVTLADAIKHSALALIGRAVTGHGQAQEAAPFPADNWARDETGLPPLPEQPSSFPPPTCSVSRLPSDSPLRADIGLLPLDHF
jgi:hypothetical protein